ncbi:acyl-CoA dehydrogenase [Roseivivax isoporae LMG 25204]|uniref:Acyl-CoA dehydrogenase n=1 Tax=Roseivivax isoporae LMG 25204 TaxID=1449351 RepID=X7F7Q1_9RHOB|nr:acyl-CoA dehydrogenase [Roseivivax isoporae LMG 25204]
MRDVAAENLSLGRLYEGHVNALRLIAVHGRPAQRARAEAEAARGMLFGVWGADDRTPVSASRGRLRGAKRFASGLGHVARALVTAETAEGQQLFLVAADERTRHDASAWDMAGMQDSRSGRFSCDGLAGEPLGPPGAYAEEPHFVGGTWRIAAVTLGGITGLVDRAAAALRGAGRMEAEAQLLRLAPIATRAVAAWPAIVRAG